MGLAAKSEVEGRDYTVRVCGISAVERMAFSSSAGGFRATVIEMLQPA
jgi:hypothetical protein